MDDYLTTTRQCLSNIHMHIRFTFSHLSNHQLQVRACRIVNDAALSSNVAILVFEFKRDAVIRSTARVHGNCRHTGVKCAFTCHDWRQLVVVLNSARARGGNTRIRRQDRRRVEGRFVWMESVNLIMCDVEVGVDERVGLTAKYRSPCLWGGRADTL